MTCVTAGGDVTVKLAENDFNAMEGQTLSVTVTVTGEQEFGDLHFQVSVLTAQQFQDQAPTCNGGISTPPGVAPADCESPTHACMHSCHMQSHYDQEWQK